MVVYRFTKYGHFLFSTHPFIASSIAKIFMENIYKLHGALASIISDIDKLFTSVFWKEFFKQIGVPLSFSSTYHPQTDGQIERMNQCLECCLRCMLQQQQSSWSEWLALGEWWYNSSFHSAIKMSPFEALYGTNHLHFQVLELIILQYRL